MYDFLYSDHERVASFLSQLNSSGALSSVEQSGGKAKSNTKKGGLNFGPVQAGLAQELEWNREVRQTYDPLWQNSLRLIEAVESEAGEPGNSINLGQIRIFSGTLLAYDLSALTSLMQSDAMDDFIASGLREDEGQDNRSAKVKKASKRQEAEVIRAYLKEMPLGMGFVLVSSHAHFWFSVKREFLSLYTLDVPLKFPTHISGQWNVLGVVDALPEDHVEGIRPVLDREIDGLLPAMVLHMLQLSGASTGMFGRPVPAHGLSPLSVYREVSF